MENGVFDGASAAARKILKPPIKCTQCDFKSHLSTYFAILDQADKFAFDSYTEVQFAFERSGVLQFENKAGNQFLTCVLCCEELRHDSYFDRRPGHILGEKLSCLWLNKAMAVVRRIARSREPADR